MTNSGKLARFVVRDKFGATDSMCCEFADGSFQFEFMRPGTSLTTSSRLGPLSEETPFTVCTSLWTDPHAPLPRFSFIYQWRVIKTPIGLTIMTFRSKFDDTSTRCKL